MGLKEYRQLKRVLKEVDSKQSRLSALKVEKTSLEKSRNKVKREKEKEKEGLKNFNLLRKQKANRIKKCPEERKESKSDLKILKDEKNKYDEEENQLNKKKRLKKFITVSMFTLLSFIIAAILFSLLANSFTCDNGYIIEYNKILDGKEDCADGSDEFEEFWTNSRAQSAEGEPWFWTLNILLFSPPIIYCLCRYVVFVHFDSEKSRAGKKLEDVRRKRTQVRRHITSVENRISAINKEINTIQSEFDLYSKKPELLDLKESRIEELEGHIQKMSTRIQRIINDIEALLGDVKNMIPYSELLK